tara:strand:- start:5734 stop:6897 length:1164 start_codon:yes stop_codon:yes gene_type:complete
MAVSATRLGLAGGIATLLGIGMARFAYTPLIPALVKADWFTIHAANYLGAINLLGYLIGAAGAHRATHRLGVRAVLAAALALTVVSFYACALDWGVVWYAGWRLACGASGAALVVVGVPAALSRVAPAERPTTGALVFSGIGLGIAASGTLVPWLAEQGVAVTWLAMALLATGLAAWAWFDQFRHLVPLVHTRDDPRRDARLPVAAIALVMIAYGLDAAGFVPHTLFWVDYIARELGRGLAAGSRYWIVFGVGAACGPWVAGALARRLGFRISLAIALAVKTAAVTLVLVSQAPLALVVSSYLVGMLVPGVVTLTSGSIAALTPAHRQQQLWGWATLSFALLQAIAAYGMSWAYTPLGSYRPLFGAAVLSLALATLAAIVAVRARDR